jgi:UDP-xylose/UDP-N-acetylglucosamine transporter B4
MPESVPVRRRTHVQTPSSSAGKAVSKVVDASPSLEMAERFGIVDERPAGAKALAVLARMSMETLPQLWLIGFILAMIFGGCCSNVFALEAIIK